MSSAEYQGARPVEAVKECDPMGAGVMSDRRKQPEQKEK